MSVQTAMTAIADKIRAILGVSGAMGLDAMAANLGTVQTDIDSAYTAVGSKGGTVPDSKVIGGLTAAISSIPLGVNVQRKAGSFTTDSSGSATVNVGFQPDIVYIQGETGAEDGVMYDHSMAMAFAEDGRSNIKNTLMWCTDGMVDVVWTRTKSRFTVTIDLLSLDFTESAASNRTYSYVAIKYT